MNRINNIANTYEAQNYANGKDLATKVENLKKALSAYIRDKNAQTLDTAIDFIDQAYERAKTLRGAKDREAAQKLDDLAFSIIYAPRWNDGEGFSWVIADHLRIKRIEYTKGAEKRRINALKAKIKGLTIDLINKAKVGKWREAQELSDEIAKIWADWYNFDDDDDAEQIIKDKTATILEIEDGVKFTGVGIWKIAEMYNADLFEYQTKAARKAKEIRA